MLENHSVDARLLKCMENVCMKKTKIVYEDDGRDKAIVGIATAEDDFVKLIDDYGNIFHIRKDRIVFMKEGGF